MSTAIQYTVYTVYSVQYIKCSVYCIPVSSVQSTNPPDLWHQAPSGFCLHCSLFFKPCYKRVCIESKQVRIFTFTASSTRGWQICPQNRLYKRKSQLVSNLLYSVRSPCHSHQAGEVGPALRKIYQSKTRFLTAKRIQQPFAIKSD